MTAPKPFRLTKSDANPILSPRDGSDWESRVTTNPSAIYDDARGKFVMLYRAAGDEAEHRVYFGLAESDDGVHFQRVGDRPVFSPSDEGAFDAGCVEDPRIAKIGPWYFVTYAVRAYPPGEYWLKPEQRRYLRPELPEAFPRKFRDNLTTTGLAATQDFRTWRRLGPITHPMLDDRDVYLFGEQIGGRWWMIHRPMEWAGEGYGTDHPAMWIVSSDDLLNWDFSSSRLLATAKFDWEVKIGGNTTPIKTDRGWMTLYHTQSPDRYYRVGAMLLDLDDPTRVTHRTRDFILEPEHDYETQGCYDGGGVVFPCGAVVHDGTLFVYYGGADKYVGVATAPMDALMDYLLSCPEG